MLIHMLEYYSPLPCICFLPINRKSTRPLLLAGDEASAEADLRALAELAAECTWEHPLRSELHK